LDDNVQLARYRLSSNAPWLGQFHSKLRIGHHLLFLDRPELNHGKDWDADYSGEDVSPSARTAPGASSPRRGRGVCAGRADHHLVAGFQGRYRDCITADLTEPGVFAVRHRVGEGAASPALRARPRGDPERADDL